MNPTPFTGLPTGTQTQVTDIYAAVDTTDRSDSPVGTLKQYTIAQLQQYILDNSTVSSQESCRVATTADLDAIYINGAAGIGATLTNNTTLAALVIDGVDLSVGDRVLVKDQSTQSQNGIYVVTVVGSGTVAWILTRASDYDGSSSNDIKQGDIVGVTLGTVNQLTLWFQTNAGPFIIGTTSIIFQSYSGTVPSYVLSITPGVSEPNKAIVVDGSSNIDGVSLADIEAAGTYIAGLSYTNTQINTNIGYLNGLTPGYSGNDLALVLDSSGNIDGFAFSDYTLAAGYVPGLTVTPSQVNTAATWVGDQTINGTDSNLLLVGLSSNITSVVVTPATGSCVVSFKVVNALNNPVVYSGVLYISDSAGAANPIASIAASTGKVIDLVTGSSSIFSTDGSGDVSLTLTGSAGSYYLSFNLQSGAVIRTAFTIS
jgi:hypothetical protein